MCADINVTKNNKMFASTGSVILDMMDISRILDIFTIVRKVWRREKG